MPKQCPVCGHPERQEIEKALLGGSATLPEIAQRFSLPKWSLYRHKHRHLPSTLIKAQEAKEVARADSLLDQLKQLQKKALTLLDKAEAAGDLRTALQGVREAKGCLELLAKLQGELAQEGTINILVMPAWVSLRTIILRTLEPYPEARMKIAQALSEVDHHAGH
jgi:transposase-like protein